MLSLRRELRPLNAAGGTADPGRRNGRWSIPLRGRGDADRAAAALLLLPLLLGDRVLDATKFSALDHLHVVGGR